MAVYNFINNKILMGSYNFRSLVPVIYSCDLFFPWVDLVWLQLW